MKPQFVLSLAGVLMTFAPGCCVFDGIFSCNHFNGPDQCAADPCDGGHHAHKKCAKKCKKCRECLEEHGYGGMGYGGDCGCSSGGGMMGDIYDGGMMGGMAGGGCGCGQGGGTYNAPFVTPSMTVPTPGSNPSPSPSPMSGTALPPPIPPIDTSSNIQIPPSVQQVSMEEFQRLPGTVISSPGAQPAATNAPQYTGSPQYTGEVMATINTPVAAPQPNVPQVQSTMISTVPANARQVQQTGWAPVRK